MHWMQRIPRPTARKQYVDEGHRPRSCDIVRRNGAFLSFTIAQYPFDESSSSIELGFPTALDGSGYRGHFRLGLQRV
jgi:hypothetical protein